MACDQLCRSHRVIPNGTAVTGRYYGHAFTGVVLSHRGGVHWCLPGYRVQVDRPFQFQGEGDLRSEVRFDISATLRRDGRLTNVALDVIPPPGPEIRRCYVCGGGPGGVDSRHEGPDGPVFTHPGCAPTYVRWRPRS